MAFLVLPRKISILNWLLIPDMTCSIRALKHTLLEAAVPKLSSSEAVSVVIFPVTPEMWNNRSPSSCTELNL